MVKKMSNDVLGLEYIETGGEVTIRMTGRLDSETAPRFQAEAVPRCAGRPVVLDMTDLKYISSAGLRAIIVLRKTGSPVRVENASGLVEEVLRISDFEILLR